MADGGDSLASLNRLYRRGMLTVRRGRVNIVDDTGAVQKIQLTISADELRDNTPKLAMYGFCSNPLPGADAVIVFVGGDQSNGVIVATGDQRYRLLNLKPGEMGIHDNLGQKVYLSQEGIVIEGTSLPIVINSTASVMINAPTTVNGNLTVEGAITATQNITAGQGGADQVTLQGHKHPTAATGAPSSPTPGT